ncbi:MAG: hypothetical protein HY318_09650 [Armatimonadetes bacterium]|nr:hypothetical protein [Armatimonadota bacterium]
MVKPSIAERFDGLNLTVDAGSWLDTVDQLSRELHAPIVAFPAKRWQPCELTGTPDEVFRNVALRCNGFWLEVGDVLCLAEALDTPVIAENEVSNFSGASFSPLESLVYSFNQSQWALFSQGEVLPCNIFDFSQVALVQDIAKTIPGLDAGQFVAEGRVGVHLSAGTWLLSRGEDVGSGLRPHKDWQVGAFWQAADSLRSRNVQRLRKNARKFLREREVVIEKTSHISMSSFPQMTESSIRDRTLVSSAQLKDLEGIVSAGKWDSSILFASLEAALHLELREIGNILFLGPVKGSTYLRAHWVPAVSMRCESDWQKMRQAMQWLAGNPRNNLEPFTYQDIESPRLRDWDSLSEQQKTFVISQGGIPRNLGVGKAAGKSYMSERRAEFEKHAREIECLVFPYIQCEFWITGRERPILRGFSPQLHYAWLRWRTRMQGGQ